MSAYRKFVDTLQREPRTPAPPKPPKVPKANPSEPVSLPILGGLGTLGAPPIKNEISLHAATRPPLSFSARAIWDDFRDEGAANGEDGSDTPLAGTAIIAPGKWVERIALPASSEPGFSESWPPRRGRIESQGTTLLHFCCVCGAWGSYGFGVNLRNGRMGRWFCAAHRAQGRRTVANDADGWAADSGQRGAATVRANPLKTNARTAADGADANHSPQSTPDRCAGLEGAALSAAEAAKAAGAAVHVRIDGGDLDRQLRASLSSVKTEER